MQPVNLRSMLAIAADVCEKMENEEDVNMERQAMRLKSIDTMVKCIDSAIKIGSLEIQFKGFSEVWNKLNPQLKNYDALPE